MVSHTASRALRGERNEMGMRNVHAERKTRRPPMSNSTGKTDSTWGKRMQSTTNKYLISDLSRVKQKDKH